MQTTLFNVTGMTCGSCVARVTNALGKLDGVHNVRVSLATGETAVKFDEQVTSAEELQAVVRNAGYGTGSVSAAKICGGRGRLCRASMYCRTAA